MPDTHALMAKIQDLPPERLVEVEDFVDFLVAREAQRGLTRAAASAFATVWENAEDDVYDAL